MVAFHPFESAENALENINAITEHEITDDLKVRCGFHCSRTQMYLCYDVATFSFRDYFFLLYLTEIYLLRSYRATRRLFWKRIFRKGKSPTRIPWEW